MGHGCRVEALLALVMRRENMALHAHLRATVRARCTFPEAKVLRVVRLSAFHHILRPKNQ